MSAPQTIRLNLASTDIPLLTKHPLLSTTPRRRRVHQIFFDTAESTLAGMGISVFETRILRKTTLTVQQHVPDTESATELQSWSGLTTPGAFDFATLIDIPEAAEALTQLAPTLLPLFSINTSQRLWTVQIRSAQVEVSLEEGQLVATTDGVERSQNLCEVELKLLAGQPAALFGVARLLSRQLRLHPIRDTLLERAKSFKLGETPRPVKAKRVRIDPKDSTIAVFKHVAWLSLDQLQANEDGVFGENCVEFIHQARVSLRRLRTALRLFNTELPAGFSDKWSQAWRDVGEQLGNARNWDVFASEMLPEIAADLGSHPDVEHLQQFTAGKREQAHLETRAWMQGRRYSLTMIAFCEALLTLPESNPERIDGFADRSLKRRYKRFRKGALVAHTLTPEARHEVRIDLKKLRYTLDFFESLYAQKQLQSFLQGLAETQELLGHMNDLATGELLLAMRPGNPFDMPVAWTKGRMSAYLEMLPAALKPVLDAKTPW